MTADTALVHLKQWLKVEDRAVRRGLQLAALQLAAAIRTWRERKLTWDGPGQWDDGVLVFDRGLPKGLLLLEIEYSMVFARATAAPWLASPAVAELADTAVVQDVLAHLFAV